MIAIKSIACPLDQQIAEDNVVAIITVEILLSLDTADFQPFPF
jgi:hypothetical protein